MAKPTIVCVDDDPQVLAAIQRDVRGKYGSEYRIVRAASGAEALGAIKTVKLRGDAVALFLVDQRMPEMSGTEFLEEAMEIHPGARKVLLTAYADTSAAIDAINTVGLDHYLMKPWDPPEEHLFPILDDLLDDWQATYRSPYEGIRLVGSQWSPLVHDIKDFFSRSQIPYRWLDAEKDASAAPYIEAAGEDVSLPLVVFNDGEVISQPTKLQLAEKVGQQTKAKAPFYQLVIVGGGPAGLAASVYGASEGLNTLLLERASMGGQAGGTDRIENYLGFPKGISGADLARRASAQSSRLGAEVLTAAEVASIRVEGDYKYLLMEDGTELSCHAVVISTGMTIRKLNVPGYERFNGAGVYYGAAISEAANYRGKHVLVVGGANSAGQGAMLLSEFADKVTVVVRGDSLEAKMSQYLVDQINGTENVEVLLSTAVAAVEGDETVERVTLTAEGIDHELEASALFIFAGAVPHSDLVAGVVETNKAGFIYTGPDLFRDGKWPASWKLDRDPFLMETSVPGIFAAGDVRHGVVRRVASAVGQGSVVVSFVHQYISEV
jgi:thioredoxin reductase (NADPH)